MSRRSSQIKRLATSATCVPRSTSRLRRWERSPTPVSVGVNTRCAPAASRRRTRVQHQLPCHAPWIRT